MRSHRILITVALAGMGLLASALSAFAVEAAATSDLNVRTGPGTNFGIVDTLYAGEVVEATECQANGWCYVEHDGPDGWVSSSYLTMAPATPESSNPDCQLKLTIGPSGPSLEIVCGGDGGGGGGGGVTPPVGDEACFYTNSGFGGQHFCYAPGTMNSLASAFNNKISSIDLHGNAKVVICEKPNLKGFCRIGNNDEPALGSFLNDRISSLQVYVGAPVVPPGNLACFYRNPDYIGPFFCEEVGTVNQIIPEMDNVVSSIMLFGQAKVQICTNPNLGGNCYNYSSNIAQLPPAINDKASSVRVHTFMILQPLVPPLQIIPVTPATHSSGLLDIPSSYQFDLDSGVVGGGPSADLWYHNIGGGTRYLEVENGAKHARGDGSNRQYPGCYNATYSSAPLPFAALAPGTYVCVKTSEGRISQFRVNSFNGLTMKIGYTTWAN